MSKPVTTAGTTAITAPSQGALSSGSLATDVSDAVALATAIEVKNPIAIITGLIKVGGDIQAAVDELAADYPKEVAAIKKFFDDLKSFFPTGLPAAPATYDDELHIEESESNAP